MKQELTTIDIIIPYFNNSEYIKDIASINKHTYTKMDMIIIDDASIDKHTKRVLPSYTILFKNHQKLYKNNVALIFKELVYTPMQKNQQIQYLHSILPQ